MHAKKDKTIKLPERFQIGDQHENGYRDLYIYYMLQTINIFCLRETTTNKYECLES